MRKRKTILVRALFSLLLVAVFAGALVLVDKVNHVARAYFPKQQLQGRFSRNPGTSQSVRVEGDAYVYRYAFRDHENKPVVWEWKYNKAKADAMAAKFGVPPSMYQPYTVRDDVIAKRKQQMKDGMFMQDGNYVIPDYSAMANYYLAYTKPLYGHLEAATEADDLSKRDRIELLMRFCQDIPYNYPPNSMGDKVISGLFPPPTLLLKKWGDCDSKAMLFASTLSHDSSYTIVAVNVPGHTFLAIKGIPQAYDSVISYRGDRYIACEPVGPARTPFGSFNDPYSSATVREISVSSESRTESAYDTGGERLKTESVGNAFYMKLIIDGTHITSKNYPLYVNTTGFGDSFTQLSGMPNSRGIYTYGTEARTVYVWMEKQGYAIMTKITMPSGVKKTNVTFNLSRGGCIYVTTSPRRGVGIYKKGTGGRYSGWSFTADGSGRLRVICDPGYYNITTTGRLHSDTLPFNPAEGKYITVTR